MNVDNVCLLHSLMLSGNATNTDTPVFIAFHGYISLIRPAPSPLFCFFFTLNIFHLKIESTKQEMHNALEKHIKHSKSDYKKSVKTDQKSG